MARSTKTGSRIRFTKPGGISHSRTICRSLSAVYEFCRDPRNLPLVVKNPVAVERLEPNHFVILRDGEKDDARIDLRITSETTGQTISWKSEWKNSSHQGRIDFIPAPADEGTEVTVVIHERGDGGRISAALDRLRQHCLAEAIADTLRRMKALLEAGEIATTDGQAVGEPQKSRKKK